MVGYLVTNGGAGGSSTSLEPCHFHAGGGAGGYQHEQFGVIFWRAVIVDAYVRRYFRSS